LCLTDGYVDQGLTLARHEELSPVVETFLSLFLE